MNQQTTVLHKETQLFPSMLKTAKIYEVGIKVHVAIIHNFITTIWNIIHFLHKLAQYSLETNFNGVLNFIVLKMCDRYLSTCNIRPKRKQLRHNSNWHTSLSISSR